MKNKYPAYRHRAFSGLMGVSQADITPPVGIYFRNWGAGNQHESKGTHLPLKITCASFRSVQNEDSLLLVSADLGVWVNAEEGKKIRSALLSALHLLPKQLMLCLSHTHAAPILSEDESSKPGGSLIRGYLEQLQTTILSCAKNAVDNAVPSILTWHYGTSQLATNRDLFDAEKNRFVVGFNQSLPADDTLLVGRITDDKNRITGTLVNYACHPTTLGWENTLVSPDYIGAMRGIVESNTMAPCLFLQGASGDLSPAQQYTGDVGVADKQGRALGYAVMATLESMLDPGMQLCFHEVIESGAPLAIWKQVPYDISTAMSAEMTDVSYPLKPLPSTKEIEKEFNDSKDPVRKERLWRLRNVRMAIGDGEVVNIPLWVWKLGDSLLVGQPNEAYSGFQMELRRQLHPYTVAVMNLVNGSAGYLPPEKLYDYDIYQVWQTPFSAGALELLIQTAMKTAKKMI